MSICSNLLKFPVRKELCCGSKSILRFTSTANDEEYSSEPKYPPILDMSDEAVKRRQVQSWYDSIQKLGTIEEKLIKVNMPRFYGWYCHMVNDGQVPYNSLSFAQHSTRTHIIHDLPDALKPQETDELIKECVDQIKPIFTEAVLYEMLRQLPLELEKDADSQAIERARNLNLAEQINSLLIAELGSRFPHLCKTKTDPEPRLEGGWVAGGMELVNEMEDLIRIEMEIEKEEDDQTHTYLQYIGKPLLHVRNELPLRPLIPYENCQNPEMAVPEFKLCPKTIGTPMSRRFITNIPGFWPGDKHQFGLLSYLCRAHLTERPPHFGPEEHQEALHYQAIFASYSWLISQACYLGFSIYNDVTYPLTTQSIITNGQTWSFYGYQLNTTVTYADPVESNPKRNILWATPASKLYERIENGKMIGFNDNILQTLLKFYANEPQECTGVEMRPYLDAACPTVAHIKDEDRRVFLEKNFKFITSNRERKVPPPEYAMWEQIYKIKFQTRPMEARRRPFELWQNPWKRKFDDHPPIFIPKYFRKDPKVKHAKTYYP